MVELACRPASVATTTAANAVAIGHGHRTRRNTRMTSAIKVIVRSHASTLPPINGSPATPDASSVQQNRERHVSRPGVVLAVENRWVQAAGAGSLGQCRPGTAVVADTIIVAHVEHSQCHPAGQNATGHEPERHAQPGPLQGQRVALKAIHPLTIVFVLYANL